MTFHPFSSKTLKWELKIGLERMSLMCSMHERRHFLFLCLLFLTLLTDKCLPFLPSHWLQQGSSCCKPFYRSKIVESFPVVFPQFHCFSKGITAFGGGEPVRQLAASPRNILIFPSVYFFCEMAPPPYGQQGLEFYLSS